MVWIDVGQRNNRPADAKLLKCLEPNGCGERLGSVVRGKGVKIVRGTKDNPCAVNEFKPHGVGKFSIHVIHGGSVSKDGDKIEYTWCVRKDEVISEGTSKYVAGKIMTSNKCIRGRVGRTDFGESGHDVRDIVHERYLEHRDECRSESWCRPYMRFLKKFLLSESKVAFWK